MHLVDVGSGPVMVMIPGVQGRWEWMQPAIAALSRTCRVITFSLADEPSSGCPACDHFAFTNYVDQVRDAMDQAGVTTATICGVSYGGLIAAAFAALHPERTASLVLVSALPPSWQPDARVRFYLRAPRLLSPLFCVGSFRLFAEIAAAAGGTIRGAATALTHGWNVVRHMFSPGRMARRVRLLESANLPAVVTEPACPVLLVMGEGSLDRIVPTGRTREYTALWPRAQVVTIQRTGHLGLMTRPDAFAGVVGAFVRDCDTPRESRRRVG